MSSDSTTTIHDLKEFVRAFRDERDWLQFHDPKNLAEAISIEASELLELFLWKDTQTSRTSLEGDKRLRASVEEELADILCFCLNFANTAKIDVSTAVKKKIAANKLKYPIERAKGSAKKYDKL